MNKWVSVSRSVISDSLWLHGLYNPQGSSVHGIFQARILEWVVLPPPGDLPDTGVKSASLASPLIGRQVIYRCTTWEDCLLRQPPNSHNQVTSPPSSFGISVTPPVFDAVLCFTLLQRKKNWLSYLIMHVEKLTPKNLSFFLNLIFFQEKKCVLDFVRNDSFLFVKWQHIIKIKKWFHGFILCVKK